MIDIVEVFFGDTSTQGVSSHEDGCAVVLKDQQEQELETGGCKGHRRSSSATTVLSLLLLLFMGLLGDEDE